MWNTPLPSGTPLSVAIGCALFLFGLSLGLVITGVCWVLMVVSGDRWASSSQEGYAYISDDEINLLIELVRQAIAGSGWTLCGDCYTHNLLRQLPLPLVPLSSEQEDLATHSSMQQQVAAGHPPSDPLSMESIDNTRERPGRSKSTRWVDLALPVARITPESGKNRPKQHLCEGQVYPVGRLAPPYSLVKERKAL
jgi:hypothetical protein